MGQQHGPCRYSPPQPVTIRPGRRPPGGGEVGGPADEHPRRLPRRGGPRPRLRRPVGPRRPAVDHQGRGLAGRRSGDRGRDPPARSAAGPGPRDLAVLRRVPGAPAAGRAREPPCGPHASPAHRTTGHAEGYLTSAMVREELGVGLRDVVGDLVLRPLGITDVTWTTYGRYEAAATGL